MCSLRERQLCDDILRLGWEALVAQHLLHRPFAHWIYYQSATDQRPDFGIAYLFTLREWSHQITLMNIFSHRRVMPDTSSHAPVHININQNH